MRKINLVFAFILICVGAAAQEIEFVKPKGGAGQIQIVQSYFDGLGYGTDLQGRVRIRYSAWSYEDAGGYSYQIYSETGDKDRSGPISNVQISLGAFNTLRSMLGNASRQCPVTLTLSSDYTITKADANCK